ncbi:MAG: gliding motility-associated ABC transporter substrate-binding protein GldG [Bacteroidales bacterium]|nr:gliding motility-associated ABC transporter substrate-binding protein GldG [Bacteroidales bacterium]
MKFKDIKLFKRKDTDSKQKRSLKRSHLIELFAAIFVIIFLNIIGNYIYTRFDLTSEKRYTLSNATKRLLKDIDETVLVRVYLEGNELPPDFVRLQNETKEMLNQFRAYNKYIEYEFVNPTDFDDPKEQQVFYQKLAQKGIQPSQIEIKTPDGLKQQLVIPAADVMYKGQETSVQLLLGQRYVSEAELINNSVQALEYTLTDAIRRLSRTEKQRIAFLQGHGELERHAIYDIQLALTDYYAMENITLDGNINSLTERVIDSKDSTNISFRNKFKLLVVPKPTKPFSDEDLYIIDQFVMYGGRVLWLIDGLDIEMDSLANRSQTMAMRMDLGLGFDEMMFTYGVRINSNLIMDIRCMPIPMAGGSMGNNPQIEFRPWYYFPEVVPLSKHPIVKNLDVIKSEFVNSIDIIDNEIRKTVLLTTSEYTRVVNAPAVVDLNVAQTEPDPRLFNKANLPIAVLLEGAFKSPWKNRLSPTFTDIPEMGYRSEGDTTKMIVISDGDIIKNAFNYRQNYPYPLGYDKYTNTMYANKTFILNAINYLCGDEDYMESRSREIKIRKLNVAQIKENRLMYQVINTVVPIVIVIVSGVAIVLIRKNRYKKK